MYLQWNWYEYKVRLFSLGKFELTCKCENWKKDKRESSSIVSTGYFCWGKTLHAKVTSPGGPIAGKFVSPSRRKMPAFLSFPIISPTEKKTLMHCIHEPLANIQRVSLSHKQIGPLLNVVWRRKSSANKMWLRYFPASSPPPPPFCFVDIRWGN